MHYFFLIRRSNIVLLIDFCKLFFKKMMSLAYYFSIVCSNSSLSYKRTQITNWDTCIIIWNLITITNSRIISILIKSLPSRPKQFFKTNICAGLVILMFYMRIIFIISHLSHWLTNRITYSVFLYKRGGGRQMRHFSYHICT